MGILVLLCFALTRMAHAQAQNPAELFTAVPNNKFADATPAQADRLDKLRRLPTTQSLTLVRINTAALQNSQLRVSVSGDVSFDLSKTGGEARDQKESSWLGKVMGDQPGSATFIVRNGDVTGSISSPKGLYRVTPLGNGMHAVIKVDTGKLPPDEPPSFREKEKKPGSVSRMSTQGDQAGDAGPIQIDVLVAYTPAAKAAVNDINATIALAVAESNQSYANSNIHIHLNLVDSFQVTYSESGKDFDTILADFVAMPDVNQRRDSSGADIAALIMNQPDYCGQATGILADASTAFAIVHYDCATGSYSFAHELGHLMGARHNEQSDPDTTPFAYGHGFRHDPDWRTIMAYQCPTLCTRLQYWSNPAIAFGGVAMGTAATNDNARVLNGTASTIAAFRSRAYALVRRDFSDCLNSDVARSGSNSVGGSLTVTPGSDSYRVDLKITNGTPGTTYHFFLKCHRLLGDVVTDKVGAASANFTFRSSEAGNAFAFDMYPEGAPAGNKFQSETVRIH